MTVNKITAKLSEEDIKAFAEYIQLLIEIDNDLKSQGINVYDD